MFSSNTVGILDLFRLSAHERERRTFNIHRREGETSPKIIGLSPEKDKNRQRRAEKSDALKRKEKEDR